jgi:hypothetical protein
MERHVSFDLLISLIFFLLTLARRPLISNMVRAGKTVLAVFPLFFSAIA